MKLVKRVSTICATAVAAVALLSGTTAHADSDGGLLGLDLLDTPSITLACFPTGQVGQGNSFTGNQNINCSQSASATGTTSPPSGNGLTGLQVVPGSATAEPGETAFAVARCPTGTTVTGGGFTTLPSDSWDVKSSNFVATPGADSGGAWVAIATNTGSGPQTLSVTAICYDQAT